MGYFKEGEFIELSGNIYGKVVYADENVFACQRIHQSPGAGAILTDEVKIYSNKSKCYENRYWIRKTEPLTNFEPTAFPILGGGVDLDI